MTVSFVLYFAPLVGYWRDGARRVVWASVRVYGCHIMKVESVLIAQFLGPGLFKILDILTDHG